ncbi:hypothetical protein VTL71DRAFT_7777 [Oculimacula yallundae]|uniref:GH16 domain-containing protein n=1 Tax=Oculimacula yallundae TaxID=86028 RepID=A0ABR4CY58_9HELO
MFLPPSLLPIILLFTLPHLALSTDPSGCSCFRTNGSSAGYFLHHQFQDFRNIANTSSPPALITNASEATAAGATSPFFESEEWTKEWAVQNWNNSDSFGKADGVEPVFKVNTANNVYIEQDNSTSPSTTHLTLRTARHPTFQSVAEIDSLSTSFHYISLRLRARVIGSPGACAGIFTYLPGTASFPVQEADIEILTRDPRNKVQYTNQPSTNAAGDDVPQATVNGSLPAGRDWSQWNVFRVDWMPKMSTWYVNGEKVAEIGFQTPRDPAGLILNMWSDGGVWTGNMSIYDQAFLQVQWIEVAYNGSDIVIAGKRSEIGAGGGLEKRKGPKGCEVVCGVDENIQEIGTPVLLFNNTGDARASMGKGMGDIAWIPLALVASAMFGYL